MQKYEDDFQYPFGQKQIQINVELIERLKLLKLSHEALMKLLSLAEKYAKYGSKDIKHEFVWQIYYFKKIMSSYIKKYKDYTFPDNFSKDEILNEIFKFKAYIHLKDKYLYDAMIDIFNERKPKIDFDKLFDEFDKESKISNLLGPTIKSECEKFENKKYQQIFKRIKRITPYEDSFDINDFC